VTPRIVAGWLTFGKFALSGWFVGSCNRTVSMLMVAHSNEEILQNGRRIGQRIRIDVKVV
jgi:hypothetical protein